MNQPIKKPLLSSSPPPPSAPLVSASSFTFAGNVILCILGGVAALNAIQVSIPAPFQMQEMEKLGHGKVMVGALFVAYPLAVLFTSLISGSLSGSSQRRIRLLQLAMPLHAGATVGFGFVLSPFLLVFLLRFFQGVAGAIAMTACYGLTSDIFQDRRETAIGILEGASGLGYMVGPALGGLLYAAGGYSLPFLCSSVLIVFIGLSTLAIPSMLQKSGHHPLIDSTGDCFHGVKGEEPTGDLVSNLAPSWSLVLLRPCFIVVTMLPFLFEFSFGALQPELAKHLQNEFGIGVSGAGLIYSISGCAYAIFSPQIGRLTSRIGRRRSALLGMALAIGGWTLIVPAFSFIDVCLGHNTSLRYFVVCIASILCGSGCACAFVPTLPMMIDFAKSRGFDGERVTGSAAGLWNSSVAIGQVLGPFYGTWVSGMIGFAGMSGTVASLQLLFLVLIAMVVTSDVEPDPSGSTSRNAITSQH